MIESAPLSAQTLADLFLWRRTRNPQAPAYVFVRDNLEIAEELTYEALALKVFDLASSLHELAPSKSRVVLLFPSGLDVVCAFWACIMAGLVPIPAPPPDPLRMKNSLPRLRSIMEDAAATLLLTDSAGTLTDEFTNGTSDLTIRCLPLNELQRHGRSEAPMEGRAGSIAYLQYTSGSTMRPRGVVLSHRNVLSQCRSLVSIAGVTEASRSLCWLPYFHDYGLVHGIIAPFFAGIPGYLMSPMTFLRRPLRWLEALDRWAITHSGAPNFAYESCVQALRKHARWPGNLARWTVASCGAEPIHKGTADQFCNAFAAHGFQRSAFRPAYGLAEATLVVSSDAAAEPWSYLTVSSESLETNRVVETETSAAGTRTLVGCGQPLPDHVVKIVNPATLAECRKDEIGEIWVSGPSVAQGYWNRPELTQETFNVRLAHGTDAGYLRTGDLGFVRRGQLFITGRLKDLIILNGRNLYPHDLERAVEGCYPGLRPAGCAAFSVDASESERLVLVQEVERPHGFDAKAAATAIRARLADEFEAPIWSVVFVRPGAIPRTSSGKVQRLTCRKSYLGRSLPILTAAIADSPSAFDHGAPLVPIPLDERVRFLIRLVAEQAGVTESQIDPDASIVNYGLDSLKLSLIKSSVHEEYGTELTFAQLFGRSTIKELAASIGAAQPVPSAVLGSEGDGGSAFALSPNQKRIWFLEQRQAGGLNHISLAFALSGPLDTDVLAASLNALTSRHAMLRAAFSLEEGDVRQTIEPRVTVPVRYWRLDETTPDAGEEELRRWIREECVLPFDTAQAPLFRVLVLQQSADRHIAVFTVHRLIGDGWSLRVLAGELSAVYDAGGSVRALSTSSAGRYDGYVQWQQLWMADNGDAQLAYWTRQLMDLPSPLQLPTDRPRPRVRQALGGAKVCRLSDECVNALDRLCREEGVTRFMVCYAGLAAWLQRCARTTDVVVGSVVANRRLPQWEQTFGYFVNPVSLRVKLHETDTVRRLLTRARQVVADAYDHQDVPFERILESIPRKDNTSAGLFNMMIVAEDDPIVELTLRNITASHVRVTDAPVEFDLTLLIVNGAGGLDLILLYDRGLFDGTTADRMLRQLHTLLNGMIRNPSARLADLSMLDAEEAKRLLVDWNDTAAEVPFTAPIPYVIESRVRNELDETAVICDSDRMSYRLLIARATALARRICRLTKGANVRIALCADRSAHSIVGLLGILKAGAAYVPLDPQAPELRQRRILEDAEAVLLVTERRFRPHIPFDPERTLELDEIGEWAEPGPGASLPDIAPDHTAYVIYTSGTTGRPKGVEVTHRTLCTSLAARLHHYAEPAERSLLAFPLAFDGSITSIFWSLLHGGVLIMPSADAARDPYELAQLIAQHRVTHAVMVPSLYDLILHRAPPQALTSLRVVVTAGESLPVDVVHRHYERVPEAVLYNEYGPTEATVWATVYRTNGTEQGCRVPIGRPIANASVYLLDPQMHPVPVGVVGDLYIGGAHLALGYLHQPALTKSQFIDNPFLPGTRLYWTGDLGLFRPDGNIEFLGRADQQAKIRGYRVEPEEIDAVLRQVTGVRAAATVVQVDALRGPALVSFVALDQASRITAAELQEAATRSLPSYMVPRAVVLLEELPLLPSGKVDREALRRLSSTAGQSAAGASPRDPVEQSLIELWSDILGRMPSDIHQSFFALGGHSLLATQCVARIRELFRVELPLRVLFDQPTIAGVAEQIRLEQRRTHPRAPLPPIVPVSRTMPLPVSYSQQRMWFIQELAPESTAYNLLFVSRQKGALKMPVLRQVVDLLSKRHEAFRTTFAMTGAGLIQRIAPWQSPHLAEIDLRRLPEDQRESEARRLAEAEAARPFDLEHGPLARVSVATLGHDDHIIILNLHHIVGDQWSFGILGRDFAAYYNALCQNLPVPETPLPLQYADYAAWQRRSLSDDMLEDQERYWTSALADLPLLHLPTDFPRPAMQTFRGSYCSADIPQPLIDALKQFGAEHGVTSFMTLLTCFQLLLSRYAGQTDVAVGSPIANRTQTAMEELIGTFVNTLVFRLDVGGHPSFSDLVDRAKETALDAFANQDYPFDRLVDKLQVERDPSMPPLIQVLFNLVNAPIGDIQLYGLKWEPFEVDPGSAQFDLTLTVELETAKKAYLTYNTDLFKHETAERFLGHFLNLLRHALMNPRASISDIPLLDASEETRLLKEWSGTASAYPADHCLFELFESQVRRAPDAVAVSMEKEALTYRELNARANRLARFLRRRGVAPRTVVGLCLERSVDMVTALLGILKAGGSYVPLDPDYPRDRIRFMVEDSGAPVVLTSSGLSEQFVGLSCRTLPLDHQAKAIEAEAEDDLPAAVNPGDLAYILYTSGSSGTPKGVEITHRSLMNFLWSMKEIPGCSASDVMLSVTTLSFDIAGLELYLPLLVGARVDIVDRSVSMDAHRLIQRLEQVNPTMMQATPTTWRMLLEGGWNGAGSLTALCGGESLPQDLAQRLCARTRALWNLYGPTETTVWSTVDRIHPGEEEITIGRPIANTEVYVLDPQLRPVPVGVPGELFIGGHGLARGYHRRPDLTAERFIGHPFSTDPNARLYRTGDLARYRPDGRLVHLGRIDQQVKIRGFRIELSEIESVLARHPKAKQVVVTARDDREGLKQLIAYLIPHEGMTPDAEELRSYIRSLLPHYMVPTSFVFLADFPLTANKKINMRALPPPSEFGSTRPNIAVPPRNGMEVQLAALWQQVLGIQQIGVHDNFFDLGGHSLKAAQLFFHLEAVFGKHLPLATLFQAPTIAQLARVLEQSQWIPPWMSLVAIQPGGTAPPLFLVPGVGGNVLVFAGLAKRLGPDQPVYGLQARGLDGKEAPFVSVPEMAEHYVEQIRQVQPEGPYFVAGVCTGGLIAYEMAQALARRGAAATLFMLDTWHPDSYARYRHPALAKLLMAGVLWRKIRCDVRDLMRQPWKQWWPTLTRKTNVLTSVLSQSLTDHIQDQDFQVQRLTQATLVAVARYRPRRYSGRIINIIASCRQVRDVIDDTRHRWAHLGGAESRTIHIPAEDSGRLFVSPYVEQLKEHLQSFLQPPAAAPAPDAETTAERRAS